MKFSRFLVLSIISLISQQSFSLPNGSYKQTCENCTYSTMSGLSCQCKKMNGRYISTTKKGCSSYENINGELKCEEQMPDGSYKQSCKDCTYSTDKRLSCKCRKINGNYIYTTKKGCSSYENINGKLKCE